MFSSYRGRFAVAIRLIRATKWEGCFRCIDAGVLKCLGVCGREVLRFLQQSGREGGGEKGRAIGTIGTIGTVGTGDAVMEHTSTSRLGSRWPGRVRIRGTIGRLGQGFLWRW